VAIRLTKNLKRIIVAQFKGGDDMAYLAGIYGVTLPRIEQVIREAMMADPPVAAIPSERRYKGRTELVQTVQPLGDSLRSTGADASVQAVTGSEENR